LKLKFQTVAEKTAKNFRELLYFAEPDIYIVGHVRACRCYEMNFKFLSCLYMQA